MQETERSIAGYPAGFSLLDGVALVSGAAVASVHIRAVVPAELSGFGIVAIWGTFSWIALSAAGPFIFIVRRYVRRAPEYPKVGDWLWALIGTPWLLSAVVRSAVGDARPERNDAVGWGLFVGIAAVSFVALGVVWNTWVVVPPEQAARTASHPWTNRLGLFLAVAWPVQCGLGLVIIG
ncbi:MAG: hypothetical protein P4L84_15635 [Isosphaeraceae bacterium]|nr:hypothetical protein [Isosphaeraceae bacterium]